MPLLASDVYPGKQIAPVSYAQSKKTAITFAKMDSTTSIRQTQNSASTLSPNPKNVKQHKITKINRKTEQIATPEAIMLEISDI